MNVWSLYFLNSGLFTGNALSCALSFLEANIPANCGCLLGEYDALAHRVDLETGEVIDYQPEQPSDNHRWNAEIKRWIYCETVTDIATRVRALRDQRIAACDWVVTKAAELSEPVPNDWKKYRAALRDISTQAEFPSAIIWPDLPGESIKIKG